MPRVIGSENEKSLHRELKILYAGRKGQTEVELGGYVVDAVTAEGEIVEIQTGSFLPLRRKAAWLAAAFGRFRVVYPIATVKYLEFFDPDSGTRETKKSPRRGSIWDVFNALSRAPELPLIPGVELELALAEVAEERTRDGMGSRRYRGVSVGDRRLVVLCEGIRLRTPADYLRFVPFERGEEFSAAMLAKRVGIRRPLASRAVAALARLGVIERTGKSGRAFLYRLRATPRTGKWEPLKHP